MLLYLPRGSGGRGLKSVEAEQKIPKIKATVNIKGSTDTTMGLVREFEEKPAQAGRRSVVKDAQKFATELWMDLKLQYPDPTGHTGEGDRIERRRLETRSRKRSKATVIKRSKVKNGKVN